MYIFAGYETTSYIYDIVHKKLSKKTNEVLSSFIDGNLVTFAYDVPKLNMLKTENDAIEYADTFAKDLAVMHEKAKDYRNMCYIDSGGYQISIGLIKEEVLPLIKLSYLYFLKNYDNLYDRAFSLDIIPSEFTRPISEFIELNRFGLLKEMLDVNNKVLRICHFMPPGLLNIFAPLHVELYNEPNFNLDDVKLAIGGLVVYDKKISKLYTDAYISALVYIIKLIEFATKRKPKKLEFHILGVANDGDIVKMRFIEHVARFITGIDIKITHDSSKIYKAIIRSKNIDYVDEKTLNTLKLNFSSKEINKPIYQSKSSSEIFFEELEKLDLDDDIKQLALPFYVKNEKNVEVFTRFGDGLLIIFEAMQMKKLKNKLDLMYSKCNSIKDYLDLTTEILRRFRSKQYFNLSINQLTNSIKMFDMDFFEIKKLVETMFEYTNNSRYTFLKGYRCKL